jgi:hypothetical protein
LSEGELANGTSHGDERPRLVATSRPIISRGLGLDLGPGLLFGATWRMENRVAKERQVASKRLPAPAHLVLPHRGFAAINLSRLA